jgi:molybdopterin-containing oxidoreductase family membrane subunit
MNSEPLIDPRLTYQSVTDKIASIVLTPGVRRGWLVGFLIACSLVLLMMIAVTVLFVKGVGIWGVNIPVAWAFAITNFVWWIGIGHAGTLISAILLLMHQKWRNSINRFAEAMTLFAVACAGLFPLLHLGRPWVFYWLFPYPDTMKLWPQFRSPLVWDVFAVSTYGIVSLLFWFTGLVPDLAAMRDQARNRWVRLFYGVLAMGWRGSARHWQRHEDASLLLAGLATPLVVSVHSVVSLDFTVAVLPGWHSTIFPPYFVAGAIYSGFAMVLTLVIPARRYYGLQQLITQRHMDNMAKILLGTGLLVLYSYVIEAFMGWYSGNPFEIAIIVHRALGTYAPAYWALIFFNLMVPQLLWFRRMRSNMVWLFLISVGVNIGMWLERYVIIVSSLSNDFLPSSAGVFHPTFWDFATLAGSMGLFLFLLFLFIRLLPMISICESRQLLAETKEPA